MIDNVNIRLFTLIHHNQKHKRLSLECLQVDKLTNLCDVHKHIPV